MASIHDVLRDLHYRVPNCCGTLALPATNGVFETSTGVIVIKWNLSDVIVSFSHEWGEIVKQVLVDCKVTGVIENLKDNSCYWDFPYFFISGITGIRQTVLIVFHDTFLLQSWCRFFSGLGEMAGIGLQVSHFAKSRARESLRNKSYIRKRHCRFEIVSINPKHENCFV